MKIRKIIALSVLLFSAAVLSAQEGGVEVDYTHPVKYKVGGVSVEGNNYFSESQIISLTGLQKGMDITVPSEEMSGIVRRLWLSATSKMCRWRSTISVQTGTRPTSR